MPQLPSAAKNVRKCLDFDIKIRTCIRTGAIYSYLSRPSNPHFETPAFGSGRQSAIIQLSPTSSSTVAAARPQSRQNTQLLFQFLSHQSVPNTDYMYMATAIHPTARLYVSNASPVICFFTDASFITRSMSSSY